MKKIPLLLIPVLIIVFVIFKASDMRTSHPEGSYLFTGTAEATEVRLSFKTSGRIERIFFDEGDHIEKGAAAAVLDDTDEKLAVDAALANLEYNNTVLAEALAGSRKQEIRDAKAALDMANATVKKTEAELEQAKTDMERFGKLYKENGVSARTNELYVTAYEKALHTYEEAKASARRANENLSLALEGTRNETIQKSRALVSISEQSLKQAQQKLAYTSLHSPVGGTVITRAAEDGEFVQTGSTVLTVADLQNLWIRGYVSETYLGKVKLGQEVILRNDSYPDREYKGKITFISSEAEFTPKTVQTYDERINFMYMIKVSVDNSLNEFKQGMPVQGEIILEK